MAANDETERLIDLLQAYLPKRLDDIIRDNREMARLALSTDHEVFERDGRIEPGPEREVMDDWRFVSLHLATSDGLETVTLMFLLGFKRSNGNPRITSDVVRIDLDRGLVITKNGSLYRLGSQGQGEPPFPHLVMICSAFHSWGFGLPLGVPPLIHET